MRTGFCEISVIMVDDVPTRDQPLVRAFLTRNRKVASSWPDRFVEKGILPRKESNLVNADCNQFALGFHP
jgi:hypothetical protein